MHWGAQAELRAATDRAHESERATDGGGAVTHRLQSKVAWLQSRRVKSVPVVRNQEHQLPAVMLEHDVDATGSGMFDNVVERLADDHYQGFFRLRWHVWVI